MILRIKNKNLDEKNLVKLEKFLTENGFDFEVFSDELEAMLKDDIDFSLDVVKEDTQDYFFDDEVGVVTTALNDKEVCDKISALSLDDCYSAYETSDIYSQIKETVVENISKVVLSK